MKRMTFLLLTFLLIGGILALGGTALAQTPTPNQIDAVAKELWCPLCNGVRLDNCDLQACIQMREIISQRLAAGDSKDQIKAYFVQQYGDVVLGAPANEGFNRIVWLLPVLLAVLGLGWLAYFVRAWLRRRPTPARAAVAGKNGSGDSRGPGVRRPGNAPEDEYLKRVDDELRKSR